MINTVVFDLDGVLVDSEPVWEQVRRDLVEENEGTWTPEAQSRLMGMSTDEWARYLSGELGVRLPPQEVADLVIERVAHAFALGIPLMPGAPEVVRSFAARWPLGLASSSPRRLIDTVLNLSGLGELFTVTVSTEEVHRGKPAPDVYLAVAEGLGAPPSECLAVEDSTNGVRSAVTAGFRCIAIPQARYPVDQSVLRQATIVLHSLNELTPGAVASIAR